MAGMVSASHWTAAVVLVGGGCLLPRMVARTPLRWSPWLLADAALPAATALLILALSGRPIFTGAVIFALCGGYAFADRSKRRVLAEPVVFTDVFQAFDIFRHPELALPFPHKGRVLLGVGTALGMFGGAYWAEQAEWAWSPWPFVVVVVALTAGIWLLAGPFNAWMARRLKYAGLSAKPFSDGELAGPLATLVGYGIIARGERAALQVAARPRGIVSSVRASADAAPVVLVQSESFFDARRLHGGIRRDLLPAFDHLSRTGVQWGRLTVPSWGANTVRTEFAVLTGLGSQQVGFDQFNPYHGFASQPITSLAWRLRAEGYRTFCLHPFDARFYGRDRVMPNLGFDVFLAEQAFSGSPRINGYVADTELARVAADILREERSRVFLFLITMENHGPWHGVCDGPLEGLAPGMTLPEAERHSLQRYLLSLRNADAMLDILARAVEAADTNGVLGFYGDHLPAFSSLFEQCGLTDLRTDYLIWSGRSGRSRRVDIDAHNLAEAVLLARRQTTRSKGTGAGRRLGDQT